MKRIRFLLATFTLLAALILTGCGRDNIDTKDTSADTDASATSAPAADIILASGGATRYTIVRSDTSSSVVTDAAIYLRKYMEKCGLNPTITTDWEKNPVSDFEIVVGSTLRSPEQGNLLDPHSVGPKGCYAYSSGTRIYVGGGSDAAVMQGVETFLTDIFGYTGDPEAAAIVTDLTIPAGYSSIKAQEFALKEITLGNRSLSEFAIIIRTADTEAKNDAKTIQSHLYDKYGLWLDIIEQDEAYNGPAILFSDEAPVKEGFCELELADGNLVIRSCTAVGGYARGFLQFLYDTLAGREGTVALDSLSCSFDLMQPVSYSQFGAMGDGRTDDMNAIIAAHEYANTKNLPVKADEGAVYYIGEATACAVIRTDTDWTGAKFIIDDSAVGIDKRVVNIFHVVSTHTASPLEGLTTLKAGQENLGITLEAPSIVIVNNTNVLQYIRAGVNATNGNFQTDILLADTDGSIDTRAPIMWDYDVITDATYLPIDTEVLTVRGGEFTTIANRAESYYNYYARGIHISRSNVVVEGLVHLITGEGSHGAPYGGFLQTSDCANVTVRNCTFTGHKTYQSQDPQKNSKMGSYDIHLARSVNLTFENCRQTTDILDPGYWGLMNSNFCKNIVLDSCSFSRFDAHQGVANVTIMNCTLGYQCLNAIGCGTLTVENSTLYGSSFINLRADYGSTWNGDVVIKNCTWIPNCGDPVNNNVLIGGNYTGFHYFGYECYMPRSITIDGLHVDDSKRAGNHKSIYLLGDIVPAWTDAGYEKEVADKGGYLYHPTETITISGFTSESGKSWTLSPNRYMYRNLVIIEPDGES